MADVKYTMYRCGCGFFYRVTPEQYNCPSCGVRAHHKAIEGAVRAEQAAGYDPRKDDRYTNKKENAMAKQPMTMERESGTRIRIRKGFAGEGRIGYYIADSLTNRAYIVAEFAGQDMEMLASAVTPHPFTKEERIERAIDSALGMADAKIGDTVRSALFAMMDDALTSGLVSDNHDAQKEKY